MKLIAIVGKKRSGKDTVADHIVARTGKDSTLASAEKYQLGGPLKTCLGHAFEYPSTGTSSSELARSISDLGIHPQDILGETDFDRDTALPISNAMARVILVSASEHARTYYGLNVMCDSTITRAVDRAIELNKNRAWSIRRFMQTLGTDICVELDKMVWVRVFAGKYVEAIENGYSYFIVPDCRQSHEISVLRAMGATIIHVENPNSEKNSDNHITEAGLKTEEGDLVIQNNGSLEELYLKINLNLGL